MTDYISAQAQFAKWGIDTQSALDRLAPIALSLHCWQGDDVVGFEGGAKGASGGIAATGHHPGRARTPDELRADLDASFALIPGTHRLNLHAIYLDSPARPERNQLTYAHFAPWLDWAAPKGIKLDFNATFFAHEKARDNLTLSHPDQAIREYWIAHGRCARAIAAKIGETQASPCIHNIWVPDGYKDTPIDRLAPRKRLEASLDAILAQRYDHSHIQDSVESKLFGIGLEAMTVGSHEFYLGYAIRKGLLLCLDMGHFHPTEQVADKLSAIALSVDKILLHASRPMRWDSDHVILQNDDLLMMAQELISADLLERTVIGLDFFDASISRTAAWVIGARNMQKALLRALLLPLDQLRRAETELDFTSRFMITEEIKDLPYGAVWSEFCRQQNVPSGRALLTELARYQKSVAHRG